MAASHRSPLIKDQWRLDDDRRRFYSHRDRNTSDRSRYASIDDEDLSTRSRGYTEGSYDTRHGRGRAGSRHRERERSHHRSPGNIAHSEGPDREEYRGEERSRRQRHRDYSPSSYSSRRNYSPHSSSRYHSEYHRGREHSSRRRKEYSLERRQDRESPPYPPRRDRHDGYYEFKHRHSDRTPREAYRHTYHRERSGSPGYTDYDRQAPRRRSPSRDRNYRSRENEGHEEDRKYRRDIEYRPQGRSPETRSHPSRSRESSPPSRPSKSSRRSEKQRQRTLNHLRARNKATDFLRSLSVSPSREGSEAEDQRMHQSPRPIQSILDEKPRQPSPPRRIPSFDDNRSSHDAQMREHFPLHGMKASDIPPNHGRRVPPHIDTRQTYATSPQYATPTSSHHGSPHSASPYSQGRGGWNSQHHYMGHQTHHMNAHSPPYRQNSYPPPGGYYSHSPHHNYHQHQTHSGYQSPSYRGHGGYGGMRGGYPPQHDRRFSGGPPPQPNYNGPAGRGRGGHYQNLQWTSNGGNHSGRQSDNNSLAPSHHSQSASPAPSQHQLQQPSKQEEDEDDNPFRPSKDFRVEDQGSADIDIAGTTPGEDKATMATSGQAAPESSQQSKEASKFSFAFKAKPTPATATKPPVPDLAQKMKEPPQRRDVFAENSSRTKQNHPLPPRDGSRDFPPPKHRLDRDRDTWYDRRDDRRERDYGRWRDDRRTGRDYYEDRYERRPERERERTPEKRLHKKKSKRVKAKPTLPNDLAASDSVYYRKPGNESVVGSGTYGKVFKAVHVYSKGLVALKKIRMEGEKDGYPVTAVREIKLLQSLKHENIVNLQEVMVERNDCFMVFEYLSHDLTGLLNHPTFKLEQSHKKHLAKQLFQGLDYLHRRGVLHRDIKAANILISNTGQLKLADFGLARFYAKRRQLDYTNRVITIWYRPPELLFGETQYGPAVDIWSAACVMVEIFTKHAIFPGDGGEINQLEKVYNVLGTPTLAEWPGLTDMAWFELLRPTERKPNTFAERYRERLTPAAFELLQSMFLYDPEKRPTAGDVLEHPYFTIEEPAPKQAVELKDLQGDWHEFESKALRRENERKDKEARRANKHEENERDKAKRRASSTVGGVDRDAKRVKPSSGPDQSQSQSQSQSQTQTQGG